MRCHLSISCVSIVINRTTVSDQPQWSFSSLVSHDELRTSFLNHVEPLSAHQMSEMLAERPLVTGFRKAEDLDYVQSYLQDLFPGASGQLILGLTAFLSRPDVGDEYFIHSYVGEIWPLPQDATSADFFHRYVTLLSWAIESAPWENTRWPHGRWSLIEFDGNFGAKALGGVEHSFVPPSDDEYFDPFRLRRLVDDLVQFGMWLANFADRIDDPTWTSWLSTIDDVRTSVSAPSLRRRLDRGVEAVLTSYFTVRGIEGEFVDLPVYADAIPGGSSFWKCLNTSIERSIPSWSRTCSTQATRLAGLVTGALDNDPFARRFVKIDDGYHPLVGCTFGLWSVALGIDEKEVDGAFRELDDLRMSKSLPFDFNT